MFSFMWSELTLALEDLAESPGQRERVRGLVAGIETGTSDFNRLTILKLICSAAYLTLHENPTEAIEKAMTDCRRCSTGFGKPPS